VGIVMVRSTYYVALNSLRGQ